ncbi:MAG: DUF4124 domain-containing protein [Cellvibrionaceae bacterium]
MRIALLLALILSSGLSSMSALAAQDYYKWTDEEGVTHYSARRPHDQPAETISVTTGRRVERPANGEDTGGRGSNSGQNRNRQAGANGTAGSDQDQVLKDPDRCEAARSNLEVLRNNARVRMQTEDGEIQYLSEEEKAQKVQEFEQAAAESC